MVPIQIQILAFWMTARDPSTRRRVRAREDESGELTGNVIFLAALAVAAAAVAVIVIARLPTQRQPDARLTSRRGRGDQGVVATVIVLPRCCCRSGWCCSTRWCTMCATSPRRRRRDAALAAASGAGDPRLGGRRSARRFVGSLTSGVRGAPERRSRRG